MRKILSLVLAAGLFAALSPAFSQSPRSGRDLSGVRSAVEAVRPARSPLVAPKQDGCQAHFFSCGQTVNSRITSDDCSTGGDTNYLFDFWYFSGAAGQTITATLSSNDFNPFLILFGPEPDVEFIDEDDDSGPGLTARIVHTLDETSNSWSLSATPLESFVTGSYTLQLQCSGSQPPPPPPGPNCPTGFFPDPEYPDFCFGVTIGNPGDTIPGTREPECIEDTVCVSGALPGRSEVFVRILGPRPNGFLWPTITRFTPSAVTVDIHQLSSGETQTYHLDPVPPGEDDLSGRQDRTGFLP